ncbi:MAG: ECF transporter S component [Candidatus Methanodesulfokora sp.]
MRTKDVAAGAILGALAMIIRILGIKIPFPPIPYLVFEFAEVPVILSLMLFGPIAGLISVLCCWIILNVLGEFVPIGPAMFLAASLSTICGIYIGVRAVKKLSMRAALIFGYVAGFTLRSIVMTLLNYVILVILMPKFLEFAAKSLSGFLGMSFSEPANAIMLILAFTALFNILQVTIVYIPSLAIVKIINKAGVLPKIWIASWE